ncbi:MAG: hypothetical protein PHG67_11500 [Bacteroidales bacterium]|nr:hypothetical protein [Bacteroidales bacterium]
MKTRFFQFFTIMLLAGLLMLGCQKEPQSVDSARQADEMVYTPKAAKLVADINSFKQKMTAVRENPHLKSGEVISKEEARWNIETLFNVTYGFPDLSYSKTITDTALVYLPVDASGNARLEDVVAVYEEVLALVTDFYLAANFDEKGFLFMQLKSGEIINGQMEIFVSSITGEQRSTPPDPPQEWKPFEAGEEWWYGELYGKCDFDPLYLGTDAAKELEHYLNTNKHVPPPPPTGFRYIYVDHEFIERFGDEYLDDDGNYLIYYIEREAGDFTIDEKCLNWEELNFHYFGQKEVIYNIIPEEENKPENWKFMSCVLTGKQANGRITMHPCLHHKNELTYAYRYLVPIEDIPLPTEF